MRQQKSNPAKTVLTISMGFLALHLIFSWNWAITVSLLIGIIGIFSEFLSKKMEYWWMKLAGVLALIVPNVLLTGIFFLILFPLAMLSRLFGKTDPLILKNRQESTFTDPEKEFEKERFEQVW